MLFSRQLAPRPCALPIALSEFYPSFTLGSSVIMVGIGRTAKGKMALIYLYLPMPNSPVQTQRLSKRELPAMPWTSVFNIDIRWDFNPIRASLSQTLPQSHHRQWH